MFKSQSGKCSERKQQDAEGETQLRDLSLGAAIQYVKIKDEAERAGGRCEQGHREGLGSWLMALCMSNTTEEMAQKGQGTF